MITRPRPFASRSGAHMLGIAEGRSATGNVVTLGRAG